jgi:hypothetical protein
LQDNTKKRRQTSKALNSIPSLHTCSVTGRQSVWLIYRSITTINKNHLRIPPAMRDICVVLRRQIPFGELCVCGRSVLYCGARNNCNWIGPHYYVSNSLRFLDRRKFNLNVATRSATILRFRQYHTKIEACYMSVDGGLATEFRLHTGQSW